MIFQAVFCGHEYAIQNLKFGLHVEPSNQHILTKLKDIETRRKIKEPSVPSTIGKKQLFKYEKLSHSVIFLNLGLEKLINPFMRVETESVQKVTQTIGDPIKTMKMLRDMKNNL